MAKSNRNPIRPDQAVTPNSAAFQKWLKKRQSKPAPPASSQQGSGSGGYGLSLVLPDEDAKARIQAIMRDICERERQREKWKRPTP